jgi:anti-sigma factor RsiW
MGTLQGYNLIHWTRAGMTYWAVSDVTVSDLQQFVQLVQQGTGTTP